MSRVGCRVLIGCLAVLLTLPGGMVDDSPLASAGKGRKSRTMTRTFANGAPIVINASLSASPFPSRIQVRGFKRARITDVDLVLRGFGHDIPQDVDVLLAASDRRNALVMSDVGNAEAQSGLTLRLDDRAAGSMPVDPAPLTGGTFRPTNVADNQGADAFDAAYAPSPSGATALSTFDGLNPNGEWLLFVSDDTGGFGGMIAEGWELRITAKAKGKNTKT